MDSRRFDEELLKKSRTITLREFTEAQSKVLADFARYATARPGDAEAIIPVMMIMPVFMAKLAHTLFEKAEPAMDEAQDADRVEKKE